MAQPTFYLRALHRARNLFPSRSKPNPATGCNLVTFQVMSFKIIQQKTGNKVVVDNDRYSIIPKLTHSLLEKYNYTCPYKGNLNNFNMYLHRLLRMIGEEFNDTVITEVKTNGKVEHISHRKWEMCSSHTGRRSFITHNVMRCPSEIEVRRCSGHSSSKTFERYISMDED